MSDLIIKNNRMNTYSLCLSNFTVNYLKNNVLLTDNEKKNYIENIKKNMEQYNMTIIKKCEICYNPNHSKYNSTIQHYIKYHTIQYENDRNYIIYCYPKNAINKDPFYICQHMIQIFNECFKDLEKNNETQPQINLIFNMNQSYPTFTNLNITYKLYNLLNNCYLPFINKIYIINEPYLLFMFTSMFNSIFNDKIECVSEQYLRENNLHI